MHALLQRFFSGTARTKVLLLRHGQTPRESPARRFIGQSDPPLSDVGQWQARYWTDQLSGLPVERIVSSDLTRCMQTARIIADPIAVPVEPLPAFREIHLGRWENMTFARVAADWPDAFKQRGLDLAGFRPPGGESFADLQDRVVAGFQRLLSGSAGRILIVGHAGVNRVLLCHLLGMPLANLFRIAQDDGAMNLIASRANGFQIRILNLSPEASAVA